MSPFGSRNAPAAPGLRAHGTHSIGPVFHVAIPNHTTAT